MSDNRVIHHKVTDLPAVLEPDSIYYVKNGTTIDVYVTNSDGIISATPHYRTPIVQGLGDSTTSAISQKAISDKIAAMDSATGGKVDKVSGKSLIADTEIARLAAMSSDAQLKNRANHTGTQDVSTITGLGTAATANIDDIRGGTTWTNVQGKPTTATRWPAFSEVTNPPATATRWPTWEEISGTPPETPPLDHTHPWVQISGKPDTATRWPTAAEAGAAPVSHTHTVAQVSGLGNSATRNMTTSTANPSGGVDGDIWYKV